MVDKGILSPLEERFAVNSSSQHVITLTEPQVHFLILVFLAQRNSAASQAGTSAFQGAELFSLSPL